MSTIDRTLSRWSRVYNTPAKLNQNQTVAVNALVILFLVMAVLQLASFNEFKAALESLGLNNGTDAWAVVVVIAEVWAALGLVAIRMNGLLRAAGRMFAVFASGFWLVLTLQAVVGTDEQVANNAFFGKYLTHQPGWLTVVGVSLVMYWTVWALEATKRN